MKTRQPRTSPDEAPGSPSGFEIASLWGQIPVEHLQVALKALEPELKREHEFRMKRLDKEEAETSARRMHALQMTGVIAGLVLAVGMIGGAVLLGSNGQPWLAALLCGGPSIIVLIKMFVLRKSDKSDTATVSEAGKAALRSLVP
ncbi:MULTISPECIES: hypothetical protein [unclassified Nonomuraea]|uniref:hypothetical protein n=1 Tax=unclassified Nonomuraea TaxID=2593643 RepID=UPI0033EA1269